jgi:hypothetical protein
MRRGHMVADLRMGCVSKKWMRDNRGKTADIKKAGINPTFFQALKEINLN